MNHRSILSEVFGKALQAAVSVGYEKVVYLLLDHGADVGAHGGVLHAAVFTGHEKLA